MDSQGEGETPDKPADEATQPVATPSEPASTSENGEPVEPSPAEAFEQPAQEEAPSEEAEQPMDIHAPKPIHNWRELGTEIGVIVIGILIALGLEQAVESWHERERVETAHEAIDSEIHNGIVDARLDNAMWDCSRTQLAALSDAVGQGDIARARDLLTTSGLPAPHAFSDAAWQSALASGVTAGFSAEEQVSFPGVYAILEAVQGYQIDYFKAEARLDCLLASGLSSSPATAAAAVPEVAQLNASLENLQASLRNYQRYVIGDLGFEFTDADRESYNSSEGSLKRIAKCEAAAVAIQKGSS